MSREDVVKVFFFFISESQFTINVNNVSFKFIYVADALSLCLCSNTTDILSYKTWQCHYERLQIYKVE